MNLKPLMPLAFACFLFTVGCASVPMASPEKDSQAKQFSVKPGKANIYLYRNETMGAAIKIDVFLDSKIVGKTAANTYFVLEVDPGSHTILSRSENDDEFKFSPVAGKNYFIWQEVKMGLLYARSKLQLVDESAGKAGVNECKLAETQH